MSMLNIAKKLREDRSKKIVNRDSIISRFLQGDIVLIPVDHIDSDSDYVEISEIQSSFKGQTFKYYYDPESDTIGVVTSNV